jgi:lipopolysaccharide/colanic/teichoic acid biosynthesis glycosyltransferase
VSVAVAKEEFALRFADAVGASDESSVAKVEISFIRMLDIAVSLTLIVVLAPLLALVALLIYFSDPGPIIFGHMRVGRGGQAFKCLKFRSMVTDAQQRLATLLATDPAARAEWARDHKLKNDPRITAIGNFLRKSSLDELPQLFNVLRGEMSLVGPRPIVVDEISRYRRYFTDYCQVRPGVTGLWQVSGRNDVSYRRRVAMDVSYVRAQTLGLNVKILLMTVPSVLKSRGSY